MDGRERREAEKELEMQEKKNKLNRKRKFDESTDSCVRHGIKFEPWLKCRMSLVPEFALTGFASAYFNKQNAKNAKMMIVLVLEHDPCY